MKPCLLVIAFLASGIVGLDAAEVITLAGNGTHPLSGDGGPALKAGIGGPFGVVIGPHEASA